MLYSGRGWLAVSERDRSRRFPFFVPYHGRNALNNAETRNQKDNNRAAETHASLGHPYLVFSPLKFTSPCLSFCFPMPEISQSVRMSSSPPRAKSACWRSCRQVVRRVSSWDRNIACAVVHLMFENSHQALPPRLPRASWASDDSGSSAIGAAGDLIHVEKFLLLVDALASDADTA